MGGPQGASPAPSRSAEPCSVRVLQGCAGLTVTLHWALGFGVEWGRVVGWKHSLGSVVMAPGVTLNLEGICFAAHELPESGAVCHPASSARGPALLWVGAPGSLRQNSLSWNMLTDCPVISKELELTTYYKRISAN